MNDTKKAFQYLKSISRYNWEDEADYRESFISKDQKLKEIKRYMDMNAENDGIVQDSEQVELVRKGFDKIKKKRSNQNGI